MAEDERIEPTDDDPLVETSSEDAAGHSKRRFATDDEEPEDDAQGHGIRPPARPLDPIT